MQGRGQACCPRQVEASMASIEILAPASCPLQERALRVDGWPAAPGGSPGRSGSRSTNMTRATSSDGSRTIQVAPRHGVATGRYGPVAPDGCSVRPTIYDLVVTWPRLIPLRCGERREALAVQPDARRNVGVIRRCSLLLAVLLTAF